MKTTTDSQSDSKLKEFEQEVATRVNGNLQDSRLVDAANEFMRATTGPKYSYNFSALGRPIIQYPQDMVAMQELIWSVKPDLIIETGIAHGGSLIMSASMLALLEYCDAMESGGSVSAATISRRVLGIDIDIRPHNLNAIRAHPLAGRIDLIQGSSISEETISRVRAIAAKAKRVMVCLDSNHTHEHVLAELLAYADLVTVGSYCVVFDTIIEELPSGMYPDRPWDKGNSPKTAIAEFMKQFPGFEVDRSIDGKLLISVAPGGYLKRLK